MKLYTKAKTFILNNRAHGPSVAFALGFIWDSLTLTRVDLLYDNVVLTFYLTAAALSIVLFQTYEAGRLRTKIMERVAPWLPFIMQFAFGGLMSGYIIYYSRSGTLIGSWPFLLFLLTLFIGNEVFKKRYQVLTFQLSILFIAFFSYTIFSIPVLLRSIGTPQFLLSGAVSLLLITAVIAVIYHTARTRLCEARMPILYSIAGLYLFFNLAYFTNIIPPIPLALKDLGIYHSVIKTADGYAVSYERPPWYRFFDVTSRTYHFTSGEPMYALSAVFAPTRLDTTILHRWSYYNPTTERWTVLSEIPFPILGGRDGGYRGYSLKNNISAGRWRIEVVTPSGQLIGRRTFTVESVDMAPNMVQTVK